MKKTWIFPDIHGYRKTLESLFDQIKPSKEEHLIFLGDYIDRGPDSKGTIDFIRNLQEEGYRITPLIGNHEQYFVEAYYEALNYKQGFFSRKPPKFKAWMEHGGKQALKSFGVKDLRKIPPEYISWIEDCEYYVELDDYVVVHAGLNFYKDNPFEDKHSMLWIKEYDIFPEMIGNRKIIHGHTPVNHEFIVEMVETDRYNFIDLDNGVYMLNRQGYGNLMAFEISSKQLVVQPNLENE
ncbi:MAG: metallophosphoesterase [Bacteroidales bacterium]|nr:metallophosphoesterase [Bacteroidales bacterium]MCF8332710.1 metallophosphoesterase [Bacteroidales bacterium]